MNMHSPVLTFLPAVLLLSHLVNCNRQLSVQTEIKNERDRQAQINKWNYNLDKHLNMPTRRELETQQEKTVQTPREIPVSIMMLAQPTDTRSRDTVVFEFDARQQKDVLQSGTAYLMIRLRDVRKKKRNNKNSNQSSDNDLKEKMKNVTDGTVVSQEMRKKLELLKNEQNEEGVDNSDRRSQKERSEKIQMLKNFTEALNKGNAIGKGKDEKNKARKNKQEKNKEEEEDDERRGKGKAKRHLTVKVVVRVLDQDTGKEKRIAAVNVEVKAKKTLLSVPIRKNVLTEAATSPRHALVLKIACKRCKRRVHMDMMYRSPKHSNEAYPTTDLELNPNRPYLVIPTSGTSDTSDNSGRDGRSKRHAGSSCSTSGSTQCCSERIFITFQELEMDKVIVYPKGFHTVTCVGRCQQTDTNKILGDSDQLVIQTNSTSTKLPEIPETDSNMSIQDVTNCQPVRKSSLDIYYLDEMKNIIPRRLVDFVDEECGCVS